MLSQQQQEQIIEYVRQYDPDEIAVFGSYAKEVEDINSDIDLLITFKHPIGLEFFGIGDDLEARLNKKVDIATPNSLSKYLLPQVELEKKVIYRAENG